MGDYLLGAHDATLNTNISDFDLWAGERKLNPAILQLEAIQKWDGKLPQIMSSGGAVPFINVPLGGTKSQP